MKFVLRELLRSTTFGLIIFIVLFLINIAAGNAIQVDYHLLIQFFYIMVYTYALHFVNAGIYVLMDRWFEGSRTSAKRIITGFVLAFASSMIVLLLLRIIEDVVIEGKSMEQYITDERINNFYTPTIILLIITFSVHAFYFYRQYQENRVKQQKIIAGTASAKFETLKNQIDPHFLFNSLNVLSSLIEENPDNAQKFTTSLSKVYRYVLEQKDKELVSIEEELAFAKTYMNLLKMRFENSLFYELPEKLVNPEAMVVPLSLQLLLENTVKHNVVSEQKPLHIRIFEQDGYLVVQNDYQKKEVLQDRRGVGLQNIISRYAIITRRKVSIEQTEQHFTVKLPTLTKQVTIMEPIFTADQDHYNKALKHVEKIKGFYGHLFSYVLIIGGLFVLNILTSPETLWFFWPAFGWGMGLTAHALSVFNIMPFMGKDWEQRKIQELMEKERNNKWR